jgi:hypothetical protein
VSSIERSRPAALAAELAANDASAIEDLFTTKRVLLRLEAPLAEVSDARATLMFLANQILRFCPNVYAELPRAAAQDLAPQLDLLAIDIHGTSSIAVGSCETDTFDAIVNVGTEIRGTANWITVNSDGWLCRVATSSGPVVSLLQGDTLPANALGALGAACLGAGQAFLALIGVSLLPEPAEISLYTLEQGAPGDLHAGPELPTEAISIDALLVGCGAVANGWIYTTRRAPVVGRLEAVDHQALQPESLGANVCATRGRLKVPKAQIVKEELEPALTVVARPERFRFFKARFGYAQSYIPEIVLSAVDNAHTRHDVQRLWAPLTIDLAAHGLTSQLVIKRLDDDGLCVVAAHTDHGGEDADLAELAEATGLPVERLRDFESQITDADIAAAPQAKRPALEEARLRGRSICGRVGELDLNEEAYAGDFTPAVPFVTAFAGVVAAAQTIKAKLEEATSLHFQFSFRSYRARVIAIRCGDHCECRTLRDAAA